jgi:hypothetical protein
MERLFSPCTRYRDKAESQGRLEEFRVHNFENVKDPSLDVSTEEFLSAQRAFTYADLYAMLENGATIAWFTPRTSVPLPLPVVHTAYICRACTWERGVLLGAAAWVVPHPFRC